MEEKMVFSKHKCRYYFGMWNVKCRVQSKTLVAKLETTFDRGVG
jgi:hypothetical protein